ncbi:hypothetical protein BDZ97DRAFT_144157 [Flammula alnicola]|nr:hypothetical protein BDZ97DRAFT_144157 [Flammula alnicola]
MRHQSFLWPGRAKKLSRFTTALAGIHLNASSGSAQWKGEIFHEDCRCGSRRGTICQETNASQTTQDEAQHCPVKSTCCSQIDDVISLLGFVCVGVCFYSISISTPRLRSDGAEGQRAGALQEIGERRKLGHCGDDDVRVFHDAGCDLHSCCCILHCASSMCCHTADSAAAKTSTSSGVTFSAPYRHRVSPVLSC